MKTGHHSHWIRAVVAAAACWVTAMSGGLWSNEARAQSEEPIASIGHGAFFDRTGNEIPLTQAFVEKAQTWYREDMLSSLNARQKRDFAAFERRLYDGVQVQGQARLAVRQRALEWLVAASPRHKNDDRTLGKLRALRYALTRPLPE
jgi:hypothetical protein